MRAATLLGVVVAAVMLLPGSAASERQKPYVLTALADIGTVYWRSDCVHYRVPEWSLGIRVFRDSATTEVTYRDGRLTRRRTAQPDGPTIWFPFRKERLQRLNAVAGGEAETIYSHVKAEFGEAHSLTNCWSYAPPRVSTNLYGHFP